MTEPKKSKGLKDWQACCMAFGAMLLVAAVFGSLGQCRQDFYENAACSEFKNISAKNLPARCIAYWQERDGG